jgi:AcrR family transcriptional regulator
MARSGRTLPRGNSPGKLTRKGAQTRGRIVAAAAELMFEGGVADTTMEMVRAAARVSSSQIYHYFANKETLVRAVIEYQNERIVGGQEPMLAKLDSLAGIRAWRDFLVEHQRQLGCRGGCPIGSLGSELAEIDPQARAAVAGGFSRWEAGIRGGFQAMHDRGELGPDASPDRLATTTLAALQGGLLLSQVQRSTEPLEVALDTLIDYISSQLAPTAS